MCLPTNVKIIQLILISLEESMGIDSSKINLNEPIGNQKKISSVQMLKISLTIEFNLGYSLQTGCLRECMSVSSMAKILDSKKSRCVLD